MTRHSIITAALASLTMIAVTGIARADCESDLLQLEAAYKTPNLAAPAKTALDDAKTKAVAALKKDDDKSCHTAVADGLTKAGLTIK
jgi:hypothetical protein